jgi:hypothetical protein
LGGFGRFIIGTSGPGGNFSYLTRRIAEIRGFEVFNLENGSIDVSSFAPCGFKSRSFDA